VSAEQKDDLHIRVKRVQEQLAQYIKPDRLLSEELIEQRRAEAAREDKK
jgi:hypothetical protein